MEYKDYYKVLGVDKNANAKEIKHAYRRLARQYHPDRNPGNKTAEDKFKEVNEAYEVLGNAENRLKYDQLGHSYHQFRRMGGNPAGFDFSQWFGGNRGSGSGSHYQQVNVDWQDLLRGRSGGFSDFFKAIFGADRGRTGHNAGSTFGQEQTLTGRDVHQEVSISLEEAYHGATRTLSGVNGQSLAVKIPRGAKSGTKIRLRGKGNSDATGPGDLYLVIQVEPHLTFQRDGDNLRVDVHVDVPTAVLGGKATVSTLTGPVLLAIPAGTQSGRVFRLRGKGMPHLGSNDRSGDLLAQVHVRIPVEEELTEEERRLYKELARLGAHDG